MNLAYLDDGAAALYSTGVTSGDDAIRAADVLLSSAVLGVELPARLHALVGGNLEVIDQLRVGVVMMLNSFALVDVNDAVIAGAGHLAWSGVGASTAVHLATAASVEASLFVTTSEAAASAAQLNGIAAMVIGRRA